MRLTLSDALVQIALRQDLLTQWGGFVLSGALRAVDPEPTHLLQHRANGMAEAQRIAADVGAAVDDRAAMEWGERGADLAEVFARMNAFEIAYTRRILDRGLELLPPEAK